MIYHTCNGTKPSYECKQLSSGMWGLWDKLAHTCLLYIRFCPFCGEEL